ncbi:MAG: 4Fe-4S binding protein [Brumimicrobium sp.]|nr:4Fe-4S binding protein [Brumimicrobium sp.]
MSQTINYSIAGEKTQNLNAKQKIGLTLAAVAFFLVILTWVFGVTLNPSWLFMVLILFGFGFGAFFYGWGSYEDVPKGIKNNGVFFNSLTNRGALGWIAAIILTLFYICLYWYGDWFGDGTGEKGTNEGLVSLFDPLSQVFRGEVADKWFVYGTFYSIAILFLGIKFIMKYRHSRYHLIRTISLIIVQLLFAYSIPYILEGLNYNMAEGAGYYSTNISNIWPLNSDFLTGSRIDAKLASPHQPVGLAILVWGVFAFVILTPVLGYFVGKRWYCSWVCGCGGLAETAGDPFRHLSDKSKKAWKFERFSVHSVMVFVLLMTVAVMYSYFSQSEFKLEAYLPGNWNYIALFTILGLGLTMFTVFYFNSSSRSRNKLLIASGIIVFLGIMMGIALVTGRDDAFVIESTKIKKAYGFLIGAIFSGIIGVGFYPLMGNRVWCRFGCPMAGYLGIIQRFKSRFRITTNGGQCISCGNCSTYCEQGIDVRWYAQRGQNIVRASCVGCGICSSVCPRGVLKLENGPEKERINDNPILIGHDGAPRLR